MVSLLICLTSIMLYTSAVKANIVSLRLDRLQSENLDIGPHLATFEDKDSKLTFREIRLLPDHAFQAAKGKTPNFGFSDASYWARIVLTVPEGARETLVLEYGYALGDEIDFYLEQARSGEVLSHQTGDSRHSSTYTFAYRLPTWQVDLPSGQHILHFRVKSNGAVQMPLTGYSPERFQEKRLSEITLLAVVYGVIAGLLLYNCLILIFAHKRYLVFYCLWLASCLLMYTLQQGLANFLFHGYQLRWWNNAGMLLVAGAAAYLGMLFVYSFLELRKQSKVIFFAFAASMLLGFCIQVFSHLNYNLAAKLGALSMASSVLVIFSTVVFLSWKGDFFARLFLIAWLSYIAGVIAYPLALTGLIEPTVFTQFGTSIGLAIENIFLSLAISFRLRRELSLALAENQRINDQLREKDLARTHFFQNISHELRTPLNGILGFLDLLRGGRYGELPLAAQQQIDKTLRLASSLKQQVNTILDLAKSKRGELALQRQLVSCEQLISDARNLAEGLALKHRGASFSVEFIEQASDQPFISDSEQLQTIIRNLLGNAFKFADPERANRVTLSCIHHSAGLSIEVRDTGIGIAGEFQNKIFEEFAQVESDARRSYEGTGLGLAMVRDLVKLMGGKIHLSSKLGEGSSFFIDIPSQSEVDPLIVDTSSQKTKVLDTEDPIATHPTVTLPTLPDQLALRMVDFKIMLIDDNESNCELLIHLLSDTGAELSYALSGRQGLALMRQQKPDLLLLDMMMPQMSGEDVIKAMRANSELADIPIILITARASQEDKILGLSLGADDYLAKPIIAQELRIRVHNMLIRHQLLQKIARHESQGKVLQLGELFSDLSHELKNILNSSLGVRELQIHDTLLALAPIGLEDFHRQALAAGSLCQHPSIENFENLHELELAPEQDQIKTLQSLRSLMISLNFPMIQLKDIWSKIQTLDSDELVFFEAQLRLIVQHQILFGIFKSTRDLSQSVLTFTRNSREPESCSLETVWAQVQAMIKSRCRQHAVRIENELLTYTVFASSSKLMQVLLNLALNAIDAVVSLPDEQRWLRISAHSPTPEHIEIRIQNSGPPISPAIAASLFQRGFTTKGERGSGIGLHLSLRLVEAMRGQLRLDSAAESPCFVITLLTAEQSKAVPVANGEAA